MKKSIFHLMSILIALSGTLFAVHKAYSLDPPHNSHDSRFYTVGCGRCHPARGTTPAWYTAPTPSDNTSLNNLCKDCHKPTGLSGPVYEDVKTHSSYQTSSKYGTWVVECRTCHNPHYQDQASTFSAEGILSTGTVSALLVSAGVSTVTLTNTLSGSYENYDFIPNMAYPTLVYRIKSNSGSTVEVWGQIETSSGFAGPGAAYAIKYGKMVVNQINTPASGTKMVRFFNKEGVNSFATSSTTVDGICQVCHTRTTSFKNTGMLEGPGHPANSAGINCAACHTHEEGFKRSDRCLDCHSISLSGRAAIMPQFTASSHHVQGVTLTNSHCYQCHWEANSDGSINTAYHGGWTAPGSPVDLVIYGAETRPEAYSSATATQYTPNGRTEIAKITTHCLGCHSEQNNGTQPFGDGKTPKHYAWDGTSVAARYSQTETTAWGKYTTEANAAKKNITKSYSAHGNAGANQEGWSTSTGVDEAIPDTTGTTRVECFDCHNSHGSDVAGTTTSYGNGNGGILKSTTQNKGGYTVTYAPAAGGSSLSPNKNSYNPGAGLCFDCHMNAAPGTTFPWGYSSTFGSTQRIMGYWDTPYFGTGTFGSQTRYPYKAAMVNQGGHFGRSLDLLSPPDSSHQINGLCTPCHDPHGVSPVLGSNMKYAVPLLKGTWLTSPYKEDVAPPLNNYGTGRGGANYHIDQNTFGPSISNATGTIIAESESQFAGLCLSCHPKSNLTDGVTHTWESKDRIHESVKGWKTANGTIQHNYSCSKCHTPHNARLPRLMETNCLNSNHKGRVSSNPSPVLSGSGSGSTTCYDEYNCWASCSGNTAPFCYEDWDQVGGSGSGSGRIPGYYSASGKHFTGSQLVSCHENDTGSVTDQRWNNRTPW